MQRATPGADATFAAEARLQGGGGPLGGSSGATGGGGGASGGTTSAGGAAGSGATGGGGTAGSGATHSGGTAGGGASHSAGAAGGGASHSGGAAGAAGVPGLGTLDGGTYDWFGTAVAADGSTLVVGAPGDDDRGTNAGAAYVFVKSGSTWMPHQKLVLPLTGGSSGTPADDRLGEAVAIDGDTLVLGAMHDDEGAVMPGSVYVYVRSGGTWTLQQRLFAPDRSSLAGFGENLSLEGDTLVIGAPADREWGLYAGAAYVFVRSGTTWAFEQKLVAQRADGTPTGVTEDFFGDSVSLEGETVIVGSPGDDYGMGSAYVFLRSGTAWTLQEQLFARAESGIRDMDQDGAFGYAVSLSGDTVAITAPDDADQGTFSGSAYVYVRSGTSWNISRELFAGLPDGTPDSAASSFFGHAGALEGSTLVVTSVRDDDQGTDSGSAYFFVRDTITWPVRQKLLARVPE